MTLPRVQVAGARSVVALLIGLIAAGCAGSASDESDTVPESSVVPTTATSPPTTAADPEPEPDPPPTDLPATEPPASTTEPVDDASMSATDAFRNAHGLLNEWRAAPDDADLVESLRPLLTERFLADESFEIQNVPEAATPATGLVVFGAAEIDESGQTATVWFCQRESSPADEAGREVSAVLSASMEMVADEWRWAGEATLVRSADDDGCPETEDAGELVDTEIRTEIEAAVLGYFEAREVLLAEPSNTELASSFLDLTAGTVNEDDTTFLGETIELDVLVISDDAVVAVPSVLGHPIGSADGRVIAYVCEPRNTKVVRPGDDPDAQDFVRRSIVRRLVFDNFDDRWVIDERAVIAEWEVNGTCSTV